jgi:hypothetical protein
MRPARLSEIGPGTRCAWEPPALTKLAIGPKTKSVHEYGRSVEFATSRSSQRSSAEPQPPAAPTTKLGFSFEMAFPLSVRTEE